MNLPVSLSVALRALGRNRLQTVLTMLGMTIGVGAVLAMIALGTGAEAAIDQQVRAAGMNLIVITAGNYKIKTDDDFGGVIDHQAAFARGEPVEIVRAVWYNRGDPAIRLVRHPEDDPMEKHNHPTASQRLGDTEAGLGAAATLTSADASAIRRVRGVQYVAEGVHQNAHVTSGSKRWFTRLHGTDVELPSIRRGWTFTHGRFFTSREQRTGAQVIVLGSVVANTLFGAENPGNPVNSVNPVNPVNPVGRDVVIWNQPFRVVGVIGNSSWIVEAAKGDDQFDAVYVPFTTVHQLLNLSKLNDITITSASTGDVTRVAKDVTELLRARHGISVKNPDDFTVTTQARQALAKGGLRPEVARAVVGNVAGLEKVTLEQLGKTLDRASRTMTALLAATAAVSLIVGGIGIMNIMLLSVTERTREIGIRRAVGARARDVLRQFLVEAMTLGVAGGGAGIIVGFVAASAISRTLKWSTTVSPGAVALSFAIAALVGIFFGWYPARQAARVHPIESLRYE